MDDLNGSVLDVGHVLAVGVFPEVAARSNDDIKTVDTSLDGNLGVLHVAANMCQDLRLEAELANGLAILAGLLGGGGAGQFNVIDAKFIKSLCDLDLGIEIKIGIAELLALSQSGFDNLEAADVAQEVADGLVGTLVVWVRVVGGGNACEAWVAVGAVGAI